MRLEQPDINLCPYLYSQFVMGMVDFILATYEYILSSEIRENIGINVKDALIVFDEGHNTEGKAE